MEGDRASATMILSELSPNILVKASQQLNNSIASYVSQSFSPGIPGFCFHYHCAVYDERKYSDTFWLADRVRLFVYYTIPLSSLCILI